VEKRQLAQIQIQTSWHFQCQMAVSNGMPKSTFTCYLFHVPKLIIFSCIAVILLVSLLVCLLVCLLCVYWCIYWCVYWCFIGVFIGDLLVCLLVYLLPLQKCFF
jgi:hypothetical protein